MNDYYYNPWESDFLHHLTQATDSVYIVAPFIKVSIVKKILTLLHDKNNVAISICTRFDKNVFLQKSSDLEVFKLLQNHPVFCDRVHIYKMNKLHAKVYIIDNRVMFISSSNLSRSGLNTSYEIAVKIENLNEIKNVINTFSEDGLFSDTIKLFEINDMNQILNEEKRKLIKTKNIYISQPETVDDDSSIIFESNIEEEMLDESSIVLSTKFLEDFNSIIYEKLLILNKINDYEFESIKKVLISSKQELSPSEKEEFDKLWKEKANNDINQIKSHIKSTFNLYHFNEETLENFSKIFIDNSWSNEFENQNLTFLYNDYYHKIGNLFLNFYIRLFIVKGRYFSDEKALLYDDTFTYISNNYPYNKILESLNLNFYLHTGDIKSSIGKNLYYRLLGFLITNIPYDSFIEIFNQFFNKIEDFVYDDYFEFNFKSRIQELTQSIYKQRPTYQKVNETGPDHNKFFVVKLYVGYKELAEGSGSSMHAAEIDAAKNALISYFNTIDKTNLKSIRYKKIFKYKITNDRASTLSKLSGLLKIDNLHLLDIALTHPSVLNENKNRRSHNKLAYIGSYIENFILSLSYFKKINNFTSAEELNKFKQVTVQSKELVHNSYFSKLNLNDYLSLTAANGVTSVIKSNTVQAIIAVVYIERGFDATKKIIDDIWEQNLQSFNTLTISDLFDSKTRLQQIIQSIFKENTKAIIEYKVFAELRQDDNTMLYIIHCLIEKKIYGEGRGSSKKKAEINAATNVLKNKEFQLKFQIQK